MGGGGCLPTGAVFTPLGGRGVQISLTCNEINNILIKFGEYVLSLPYVLFIHIGVCYVHWFVAV